MLECEQTNRVCENCGKEFTTVAEIDDDYKNYCSQCYDEMKDSQYDGMSQEDMEYEVYMNEENQ